MDETTKAVLLVMVGAGLTFIAGELRAMRDDRRTYTRELRDRQREVTRRWVNETRDFLSADFDAMERHLANGGNVVRARQSSFPMATHALLADETRGWLTGLRGRVWSAGAGSSDPTLLAEIESIRDRCMRELTTQEIRVESDELVPISGGPPTAEELLQAHE